MIPHGVTWYNELSATTVITRSHNLQKPTGFSNIQQIYSSVFRVHDSIYALLILLVAYGRVSMLQQNIYDDVTVVDTDTPSVSLAFYGGNPHVDDALMMAVHVAIWRFLCCWPKQVVKQTVEFPMIWDHDAYMTSL